MLNKVWLSKQVKAAPSTAHWRSSSARKCAPQIRLNRKHEDIITHRHSEGGKRSVDFLHGRESIYRSASSAPDSQRKPQLTGDGSRAVYNFSGDELDGAKKVMLELRDLWRGQYFGELSIINKTTRTASVVSKSSCRLLVLPKLIFQRLGLDQGEGAKSLLAPQDAQVICCCCFSCALLWVHFLIKARGRRHISRRKLQRDFCWGCFYRNSKTLHLSLQPKYSNGPEDCLVLDRALLSSSSIAKIALFLLLLLLYLLRALSINLLLLVLLLLLLPVNLFFVLLLLQNLLFHHHLLRALPSMLTQSKT